MRYLLSIENISPSFHETLEQERAIALFHAKAGATVTITSLTGTVPSQHWYFDPDEDSWIEGLPKG